MAANTELYGAKKVLEFYSNQKGAPYKIVRSVNPGADAYVCEVYEGKNKEDGSQQLERWLNTINKNDTKYCIVVTNGTKTTNAIFELNEQVTKHVAGINQTFTDPALLQLLNQQTEKLNELTSKINALESEEEETAPTGIAGILTNEHYAPLMAHIAGKVVDIIDGLAAKYTKPKSLSGMNYNQSTGIAGIAGVPEQTEIEKIEAAITVLMQYDSNLGDHLTKLAAMAQTETAKFNMLIKML
jgi:hypothetical protein